MTRISPGLAAQIRVVFKALEAAENAGAALGAVFALRELLRMEQVEFGDLGCWIASWADYEQQLVEHAERVRCDVRREVADADDAAAMAACVDAIDQ
jgi:hypothetical protein